MKKQVLFLAALAIALMGCRPEQSQLTLDSIQDTAVVSGNLVYSIGQEAEGTDYSTEVQIPATGKRVYVDIPYSSYSAGAQGTKTFQTVVDSAGNFTLNIPVPTVGVEGAKLRFEEFTCEQSLYQRIEDGEPVFEIRMCKFTVDVENTPELALPDPLKPENFIVPNICYKRSIIDMQDYKERVELAGTLLLPYESGYRTGAYKAAAECVFEITIVDGQDREELGSAAEQFTYGTTTDNSGAFTLNIPLKDLKKGFEVIKAEAVYKAEPKFTHYTNAEGASEQLAGAYTLREALSLSDVSVVTEGVACNIGERALEFIPGYNNGIDAPLTSATWDRELAGWVFAEQAFRDLQASATLKGSIALAAETGFGVGTYTTSAQTITLTGSKAPFDRLFTILTNADGTFELTIPAAEDGINPGGAWSVALEQPKQIAFTHYASATKQVVIKEGAYNELTVVRAEDADWNDLGKFYYYFKPANDIPTFCTDLAGWVVKPDYNETATIKARFFFPVETGYCTGQYSGAALRARVKVLDANGETTYVAPIATDGTFSVTIPVKNANAVLTADEFELIDNVTEEFKHYQASKTQTLAGKYELPDANIFNTKDAEWNDKWTFYYEFTPDLVIEDYTKNLLGWMIYPENCTPVTWTATVQMPVETGFWKGAYEPLANKKVQVSYQIGRDWYNPVLLSDANGVVSCPIYLQYGIVEPEEVRLSIFEDEMIHYYNPSNTSASTTLEGRYDVRLKDPVIAAWNAERTYYMQFTPTSDVSRLSWPADLIEWYVLPAAEKKANAQIKLYAQKAIETATAGNHEAGWTNAANVKATIDIYDKNGYIKTINRQVSGRSLIFTLPLRYTIDDETELYFSVTLTDIASQNITPFNHWANPLSEGGAQVLYGNYEDVGNISWTSVLSEDGKTFELKESAKMVFKENGSYTTPAGYTWNPADEIE